MKAVREMLMPAAEACVQEDSGMGAIAFAHAYVIIYAKGHTGASGPHSFLEVRLRATKPKCKLSDRK